MIDTFADYWYQKQRKNPALVKGETKMTISVDSLKSELKKAFDAGKLAGSSSQSKSDDPMDVLGKLFGKGS